MLNMGKNEPLAVAVTQTIHRGDVDGLNRLLGENPGLTTARINQRSLLHMATHWPGHFPNIAAVVTTLIAAGCDPNAPGTGPAPKTPLHWAASSDHVKALDALIDGGADMEVKGASIAGGTSLDMAESSGETSWSSGSAGKGQSRLKKHADETSGRRSRTRCEPRATCAIALDVTTYSR